MKINCFVIALILLLSTFACFSANICCPPENAYFMGTSAYGPVIIKVEKGFFDDKENWELEMQSIKGQLEEMVEEMNKELRERKLLKSKGGD